MELWDLYTKDRIKTDLTMVRGDVCPDGFYRIVVHICIFNRKGEMLIQQRQPFKDGWSNMWDFTAAGSAVSGDTSSSAAERELSEELGIHISFKDILPSLTVTFDNGFDDFYLLKKDIDIGTLKLQYEEVKAVKWANLSEIFEMVDNKSFIPFNKSFIELLFFIQDHNEIIMYADPTAASEQ